MNKRMKFALRGLERLFWWVIPGTFVGALLLAGVKEMVRAIAS